MHQGQGCYLRWTPEPLDKHVGESVYVCLVCRSAILERGQNVKVMSTLRPGLRLGFLWVVQALNS